MKFRTAIILSLVCIVPTTTARAVLLIPDDVDHSAYDDLLRSYVNADGLVNYEGLRGSSLPELDKYLALLATTDMKERDHKQKLAFWINAYNAHVIREVLNHPDMDKITEHPEIFDTPLPIAKGTYTLNDIDYRIIRGKINPKNQAGPIKGISLEIPDPRVHFSLVNGTVGAPPLRNFAYTAANIEETLRQNSADFANSPKYVALRGGQLQISSIMNDYAEEFDSWGGSAAYLARLIDPKRRDDAEELKKRLITDFRKANFVYDESVDDILHAPTKRPKLLRSKK